MKGKLAAVALALILPVASCGGQPEANEPPGAPGNGTSSGATTGGTVAASGLSTATLTIQPSGGATPVEVEAEIANDPAEQERGLMERTALPEDAGMLFVFDRERTRSFWMRNTLIPLSIAYLDDRGRIVDLQDMKPLDDEPPNYDSAEPAQYALEVNQGFFAEHGIRVGDTVRIPEEYR